MVFASITMHPSDDDKRGETVANQPIRVVLADDHEVMRRGLQMLLDAQPDLEVVGHARDITAARRAVVELTPDVLVLDLNMPGGSSLEAIPRIRADAAATQIVVLTMEEALGPARATLRAGALAYVLKDAADTELLGAIRRAADGERYVNPRLAGRLVVEGILDSDWS